MSFYVLTLLTISALLLPAERTSAQNAVFPVPTVGVSTTITAGGTFQQVLPSVPVNSGARRSLTIQNNNGTATCEAAGNCDYCWLHIGASTPTSTPNAIQLGVGQAYTRYYPYVPSDAIQATCTTSGDFLYVDSQ
jgi:hypothetical protein